MMIYLHSVVGHNLNPFTSGNLPDLPPMNLKRPAITPPRAAQREYSDSELSTAATMLAKMRLRHDVIDPLRSSPEPIIYDSDKTIDKVVDHLLRHLK